MTKAKKKAASPETAFEQYFGGIVSGKIVACEKMKLVAAKLMHDFENPGEYHFDAAIASKHTDFIERFCKRPAGRLGEPLVLELFQKAIIEAAFGFVDDRGLRKYNEVLWIMGRKNAKTTTCSAIEIDLLANDNEGSPQIFNVATKHEQAMLGFNSCHKMVRLSPELRVHIRKRVSDLYCDYNFGTIQALASNTKSLDGLDVHGAVIDELGAIQNRDIYDLIKQGMASREQPMLWVITTNGFVRDGVFDAQYAYASDLLNGKLTEPNEHFLPLIYELDNRDEWDKEDCWVKANPGIGTIKNLDFLRQSVAKAKDDPAYKPTVLVKDFNMIENTSTAWLSWGDIENKASFDFKEMGFRYGIGGFDAADSVDLNAAVALCMKRDDDHIYMRSMYWLPESVLEKAAASGNRRERDDVPYLLWEKQGRLRTYPGNKVNKRVFLDWFKELRDEDDLYILYIGYDPWHIDDSLLLEFQAEFGRDTMVRVRQGVATMSTPLKELRADLQANRIVHNSNPIDMWCMANAEVRSDVNAEIQLSKGMDPRKRIDGLVALANGYIALTDKRDDYINLI